MAGTAAGERGSRGRVGGKRFSRAGVARTERLSTVAIRALASPRGVAAVLAALTALALGLRLAIVGQSLFGDELFLWAIVDDQPLGRVFSVVHDTEKTPPLGFVLSWLPTHVSEAPEVVRLPSLLAGVATVPLVYALGLRTIGKAAGIVAAACFALSPFEIFYGTESRSYAVVTAFVVVSTLALLAAVDERRTRWWALYVLAAAAAVYTHYIAVLILVPQAAWAAWAHRDSLRQQLISSGLVVLAFLPWLPSFIVQFRHSADEARRISEMAPLTLSNVAEFAVKPLLAHPYVPLSDIPGTVPSSLLGVLLGGAFIVLAYSRRDQLGRVAARPHHRGALLVLLTLAPLMGLVLYSLRPNVSFLLPRNLAVAVPYALLLIGWALTRPRRRVAAALSAAALAAVAVGAVKMLDGGYQRPDARDAAAFIDGRAPAGVPVLDWPGPHAIRTYLQPARPVYTVAQFARSDWAEAARAGAPVFFSFPRVESLVRNLAPPPEYRPRYRLVSEHTSPGVPFEITVREYVPR
jgi:4-amino-4-deoxy-L-arabinose transferase-like glycosyltransferase